MSLKSYELDDDQVFVLRSLPPTALKLSERTTNLLSQHGYATCWDTLRYLTREEVLGWKNAGEKTFQEIQCGARMLVERIGVKEITNGKPHKVAL